MTSDSGSDGSKLHTSMTGSHNSKVKYATESRWSSAEWYGGEALCGCEVSEVSFGAGCKIVNAASNIVPGELITVADIYTPCAVNCIGSVFGKMLSVAEKVSSVWALLEHSKDVYYRSTSYGCHARKVCKLERL